MSYVSEILNLPLELQRPILRVTEALAEDLRGQLAVRREDMEGMRTAIVDLMLAQTQMNQRLSGVENALNRLADAQMRTEGRVDSLESALTKLADAQARTEERVNELAQAQARTEERVNSLEITVARLADAQARTEQRLDALTAALERFIESTNARFARIERRLNGVVGDNLERRFREKSFAYFGHLLRQVRTTSVQEILDSLEERLSSDEVDDLIPLDVLISGRVKQLPDMPQVWLAMEVSYVVDSGDVERAVRRASLLQRAGFPTIPTVAGEEITDNALDLVRSQRVLLLQDGRRAYWDEALAGLFTN